ncbi:MAG: hypothetical protein IJA36_01075 [Lachnospiraceae bacterium]|nr:hypothetical protein [Lachnospiraceae bacterium]
MNKKRNYLKLSTLFFSLLLTMVFALAIPSTSKAAYLGKVTNLKQVAGEYFKDYGKYIIAVEYKQVAGAYGYVAELSTNNVSWTPVDEAYNSSADTFLIGTKTTLKPGTTYYIRITPIDSNYNFDSADTSDSLQVVTAPAAVSGTIKQTGAKSNSVSVSWNKATGATGYDVYVQKSGDSKFTYNGSTTSTSYKMTKYNSKKATSDTKYSVGVYATRTSNAGYKAYSLASSTSTVSTLPSKTKKLSGIYWKPGSKSLSISWTASNVASGYQVYFYNSKNKLIKKATTTTNLYTLTKAPKNSVCYAKVRPFIKTSSGKKLYSAWSKKTYFVSQPALTNNFTLTDGRLTVKWNKVSGISNYAVYIGTTSKNMKKVATVSSKSTSYTTSKVNGSTVSKYKSYYVKVVPQKKVGGTTYKGDYGHYYRLYLIFY